ncbi:MAG: YebC/PmpR family DNA-binding transcriptional regulator [Prochlorococcus sp.]
MAGHSKWAQIKRTKAVVDAKRGAVFTRLAREITVAARSSADPAGNFQLRTAINKAKAARMPAANIERAIAKGSGHGQNGTFQLEAIRYEGYGPGGIAVLVEALTDNRNRTAAELRLTFNKHGGNLGESGCVAYLFEQRSEVHIRAQSAQSEGNFQEDALLENLIEIEADGYELIDEGALVYGPFKALEALQNGLKDHGWNIEGCEHCWRPLTTITQTDKETSEQCLQLLDALDELDDVNSISSNLDDMQ